MRRQAQAAAVRHGIARVQAQVEDRLLDLRRVDVDQQRVGGATHGELDARPGHRLGQLRARPDDLADVDPLPGAILGTAEGDQPSGEVRRAAQASQAARAWSRTMPASPGISAISSMQALATSSVLLKS